MRVMLQDLITGKYFLEFGQWTAFPWQAKDFGCCHKAIDFARKNQLSNLQIELRYTKAGQKFCFPLEDSDT